MKIQKYISNKMKLLYLIIFSSFVIIASLVFIQIREKRVLSYEDELKKYNVSIVEQGIMVQWEKTEAHNLDGIQIKVADENGKILEIVECGEEEESYFFSKGEHGKIYKISGAMILDDGCVSKEVVKTSLFLDFDRLPEIPILNIKTITGEEPTYEVAECPEGCVGWTIRENEYVDAVMQMESEGKIWLKEKIGIRVRGNSSASTDKKPYKIKLDKAADLLGREKDIYASTEWALLKAENLKIVVGSKVAQICGMEWVPSYKFVNVVLNGDWKGTYVLIETVAASKQRCNISPEGYLIENDAYWWNADGKYFKVENQIKPLGYTFKYPKDEDLTEEKINQIREYVNIYSKLIQGFDSEYLEYIDVQTWAGWLLMHDILGSGDGGGTNMYFYKYDFNTKNPTSSKMKMGPAWDFDRMYSRYEECFTKRFL